MSMSARPPAVPVLKPRSPIVQFSIAGALLAGLIYTVLFVGPSRVPVDPTELGAKQPAAVAVPTLDRDLLANAKDGTREQRLFLEPEPFSHLLEKSFDVEETKARALGRPDAPVPVADLRADPATWRGRWLFYRGKVVDIAGPRRGNPIDGEGIYEATLQLAGGETVLVAFSKRPEAGVVVGGWARAEGFFLKIRDLTFPTAVDGAPLLVGRQLYLDYEDWPPVAELEPRKLGQIVDVQERDGQFETAPDAWRTIDEDQDVPLWHLAAFAREHKDLPLTEWRRHPALASAELWHRFFRNEVERGTPMRILGPLVALRTIRAKPNPAGIHWWTEAWIQVRDLQGRTIPIWIPDSIEARLGDDFEVRGYYLRRLAYRTLRDRDQVSTLFVAASLDPFVFDTSAGMRSASIWLFGGAVILVSLVWIGVRRERRRMNKAESSLAERRRRRQVRRTEPAAGATP